MGVEVKRKKRPTSKQGNIEHQSRLQKLLNESAELVQNSGSLFSGGIKKTISPQSSKKRRTSELGVEEIDGPAQESRKRISLSLKDSESRAQSRITKASQIDSIKKIHPRPLIPKFGTVEEITDLVDSQGSQEESLPTVDEILKTPEEPASQLSLRQEPLKEEDFIDAYDSSDCEFPENLGDDMLEGLKVNQRKNTKSLRRMDAQLENSTASGTKGVSIGPFESGRKPNKPPKENMSGKNSIHFRRLIDL